KNSMDAAGGDAAISASVALDPEPGFASVTIDDNGPGIGLANPNDVFLPFVTTKKGKGDHQGLGLYVVYGIVQNYGGSIAAENRPEGGCRFSIKLPLAKPVAPDG
ncbi:MAG: ATP-binding protein, partial [Planctomycetes bacterium]|nr:ATP-binding protein [Planctomycetota bacterium]